MFTIYSLVSISLNLVMVPRPQSATYPAALLSIISSTTYPPIPDVEELESLLSVLNSQTSNLLTRDEEKNARKERKRKEREEAEERAALEANERIGMKLEAMERARMGRITGSPAGVRVKKERTGATSSGVMIWADLAIASPAPSTASSASFRPAKAPVAPIAYGSQPTKKKKLKRVVDSDDEGGCE